MPLMIRVRSSFATVRRAAVCALAMAVSVVTGDRCPLTDAIPARTQAAEPVDEPPADDGLQASGIPLKNPTAESRLRSARQHIERGEFGPATAALRELLEADSSGTEERPGGMVVTQSSADEIGHLHRYQPVSAEAARLLRQLPPESVRLYEQQTRTLAAREFEAALQLHDYDALRRLPARYPHSPTAVDSLRHLAAWHLDQGEFVAARSAVVSALEHAAHATGPMSDPAAMQSTLIRQRVLIDALLARRSQAERSGTERPTTAQPATDQPATDRSRSEPSHTADWLPEQVLRARLFPALQTPAWFSDSDRDPESAALIQHALHEQAEHSIPLLPRSRPVVVGDVLLYRTLSRITAHNLTAGTPLWSHEVDATGGQSSQRLTMNLSLQDLVARSLARQIQIDTAHTRMTVYRDMVLTVEPVAWNSNSLTPQSGLFGSPPDPSSPSRNHVVARDIVSGRTLWTLTGRFRNRARLLDDEDTDDPSLGTAEYFPGPPTVVDRTAFGLMQFDDELSLYAVDTTTGDALWTTPLATVPRLNTADSDWRAVACPVVEVDGVLVCPTAAGVIMGVDLVRRQPIWALRYARTDLSDPQHSQQQPLMKPQRYWWQGWREIRLPGRSAEQLAEAETERAAVDREARSILLMSGPDRQTVLALDARTGGFRWDHAVAEPVELTDTLTGPGGQPVALVIERHQASALSIASGNVLWSVTIPSPAGSGYVWSSQSGTASTSGDFYVLPVRDGRLLALRTADGHSVLSVDHSLTPGSTFTTAAATTGSAPGTESYVVQQTLDRVQVWPSLASILGPPEQAAALNTSTSGREPSPAPPSTGAVAAPDNDASANHSTDHTLKLALAERSAGRFESAISRLRSLPEAFQKSELQRTQLDWLQTAALPGRPGEAAGGNGSAAMTDTIRALLEELTDATGETTLTQRVNAEHLAARAAAVHDSPAAALNHYIRLVGTNPGGSAVSDDPGPLRHVRRDRLIQGEVLQLFDHSSPEDRTALRDRFQQLATDAEHSRDPFAVQRFSQRWNALPDAARLQLNEDARIGTGFVQSQLLLLELADRRAPMLPSAGGNAGASLAEAGSPLAGRTSDAAAATHREAALSQLIALYQTRRYDADAAAAQRWLDRIGREPSRIAPSDHAEAIGTASPNEPDDDAPISVSPWPSVRPVLSEQSEQPTDTRFVPVPVDCQSGALFDRLNVAVNTSNQRAGTTVRFYGDGNAGSWTLTLPAGEATFRPFWGMLRGWAVGHFLVLRVGGELFGITPYDPSGEPRARLIWTANMARDQRVNGHRIVPGRPGFSEPGLTLLDPFDAAIADVGTVCAGYLCYRTAGKLVCLDTATGQTLWERYEVPRTWHITGDEQAVFLVSPQADVWQQVRSLDGREVLADSRSANPRASSKGDPPQASTLLTLAGGWILRGLDTGTGLHMKRIELVDLRDGRTAWVRDFAAPTAVFQAGRDWLGLLSPDRHLQIIELVSGQPVRSFQLDPSTLPSNGAGSLRNVCCVVDARSVIIGLSDTRESPFMQANQKNGGYRNPLINGGFLALDAMTGDRLWEQPARQQRLSLEQSNNSPLLILSDRRQPEPDKLETVVTIIDRRTGELIQTLITHYAEEEFLPEPNAPQQSVTLRFRRRSVKLDYAASEPM